MFALLWPLVLEMYYFKRLLIVVPLVFCRFSAASVSDLPPIGFAEYLDLGQEQFVVSVNAENFRLVNEQNFSMQGRQQINLKVTADQLSARKLRRFFIQGAAVNNTEESLKSNSVHMASFASSIKGRLVKGDHLAFSFDGQSLTAVHVNDIELVEIKSADFFYVVLSALTGEVPPSRDFKNAILGLVESADAKVQYAKLSAAPSRKLAISQWLPKSIEQGQDAGAPATTELSSVNPATPEPTQSAESAGLELVEAPTQTPVATRAPTAEPTQQPQQVASRAVGGRDPVELAMQLATTGSRSPLPYTLENSDDESDPPISAASILKSQLYAKELLILSQGEIIYPRRAQALKQTGNVLASVTIDRKGKVRNVSLVNESGYSALNKAVIRGIKKAQPFPPIPQEIEGSEFSFVVPVTFALR